MNFQLGHNHSVILMSIRQGAPYNDRLENDGSTIIYEGHDVPRSSQNSRPKNIDQSEFQPNGRLTDNGRFHNAAQGVKLGKRLPERVRVYEKIKQGIWSYNGVFHLVDSWLEQDGNRHVFKFKLIAVEGEEDFTLPVSSTPKVRRIIPTWVKLEVWKRDGGKCVKCESEKDLHFDHIIPWSKGGSSNTPDNIQLLCGKHNIEKHDRIE
ncbi:MAG: HNH endonuclease [Deltaproteobacteria bacterium]|nr:HNH endonuclease [Candidatus Zymogenaceae bacterium]